MSEEEEMTESLRQRIEEEEREATTGSESSYRWEMGDHAEGPAVLIQEDSERPDIPEQEAPSRRLSIVPHWLCQAVHDEGFRISAVKEFNADNDYPYTENLLEGLYFKVFLQEKVEGDYLVELNDESISALEEAINNGSEGAARDIRNLLRAAGYSVRSEYHVELDD